LFFISNRVNQGDESDWALLLAALAACDALSRICRVAAGATVTADEMTRNELNAGVMFM
jgi:hypothetical protein